MARRRSWLWIPIFLGFLVVVFWGTTWALNRMLGGGAPGIGTDAVIQVDLGGTLVERPLRWFGGNAIGPLSIRELDTALRDAAEDDRVRGVVLEVGPLATGFAKAQEVRAAVHAFRESGKPVAALVEIGTLVDLYVASAADRVVLIPSGNFLLGLVSRTQYYTELLDRLGVGVDVFHTGPYKSAGNPYTETDMSPEEREAIESLLGSLYSQILSDIAADRGLQESAVAAAIDRGLLDADDALAAGLVDELGFRDAAREAAGLRDERDPIRIRDYARSSRATLFPFGQRTIALVHVDGMILPGEAGNGPFGDGGIAGGETIARYLRDAREDEGVAAVVVRVDSPGGAVTASDVILREMQRTAETKPVVVSMSDVAASGGYWIATGASEIFADRATLTGSIGVVSTRFNLAGTYEKIGVENAIVKRGENADLFVDSQRLEPDQRRVLQDSVERHYESFLAKVAAARGMTPEQVEAVAQGRVWSGAQALELDLIDSLGGYRESLESARRAAGIDLGEPYRLRVYPEDGSLFDSVLGLLAGVDAGDLPGLAGVRSLPAAREIGDRFDLLARLSEAGHAWALSLAPVPGPAR